MKKFKYQVLTMSERINGLENQLIDQVYNELKEKDINFLSFVTGGYFANAEVKSNVLIDDDVTNAPLNWLSAETGDTIDWIKGNESSGGFFLIRNTTEVGGRKINYSVCYYWCEK